MKYLIRCLSCHNTIAATKTEIRSKRGYISCPQCGDAMVAVVWKDSTDVTRDEINAIAKKASTLDWLMRHAAREIRFLLWLRRKSNFDEMVQVKYILEKYYG